MACRRVDSAAVGTSILQQVRAVRDIEIAIQPGGDNPISIGGFIQVDHLGLAQVDRLAAQVGCSELTGMMRGGGEYPGMDFDTSWDT
jgi:hypothetical protein